MTTEAQPTLGEVTGLSPLGTRANPRLRPVLALATLLAVTYAVSALGGLATARSRPTWYAGLAKPPLTPPSWLFAPVWALLYTAMAIAAWLVWQTRESVCRTSGLRLYAVQLLLNLSWSWIFFLLRRTGLSVIEIVLLWLAIALTIRSFRKMSHKAAWLFAPYLVWVSYAAYLNFAIWLLNR